jgi:hexokinase
VDEYELIHDDAIDEDEEQDEELAEMDPSVRAYMEHERKVDEFLSPLALDEAVLYRLARRLSTVYKKLALESDQQFLPTPVSKLPTGLETGRYLAIDVGGTNLRVAFIELLGDTADPDMARTRASERPLRKAQTQRVKRTLERAWPIQEHLKMDKAEDLFAWIGDCIAEVVAESLSSDATKGTVPEELDMGITFSFPIMYATVLARSISCTWLRRAMVQQLCIANGLQARISLRGYAHANG